MKATPANGVVDKANAEKVDKDPTTWLTSTPMVLRLTLITKMYISVEVAHKWGALKKRSLLK
ncbi:hypothetical protein NXU96_00020 [Phocaeicola vulgatus]|nr:hypothetical protein [Phocaeicola vulgatus]